MPRKPKPVSTRKRRARRSPVPRIVSHLATLKAQHLLYADWAVLLRLRRLVWQAAMMIELEKKRREPQDLADIFREVATQRPAKRKRAS